MTTFSVRPEATRDAVVAVLGDKLQKITIALGEVTAVVAAADYLAAAQLLRDSADCQFEQLIDLCGVDYLEYKNGDYEGLRFCVVTHLLSVALNQRLRLKVYATDDGMPVVASVRAARVVV